MAAQPHAPGAAPGQAVHVDPTPASPPASPKVGVEVFGCDGEEAERLKALLEPVGKFSNYQVRRSPDTKSFRPASRQKDDAYPLCFRLASVLLDQLGRDDDRRERVAGVPRVGLKSELGTSDERVVISAETVQKFADSGRLADPTWEELGATAPTPEELWGTGEFSVTRGRLQELLDSTQVVTSKNMPPRFYAELVGKFTAREENLRFFFSRRHVPLIKVGDEETERTLLERARETLSDGLRDLEKLEAGDGPRWRVMAWQSRVRQARANLAHLEQETVANRATTRKFARWRKDVEAQWRAYKFASEADCRAILRLSLTELSTDVCVSQQGYFMVHGCGGSVNQVAPATPETVTFLSAAGIDFCTRDVTLLEAPKYFRRDDPAEGVPAHRGWRGLKSAEAEAALRARVRSMYTCIFEAARRQNIKHMCMLPVGQGVFLDNLHAEDKEIVAGAYRQAQIDLLCEEDWGFDVLWLNAAMRAAETQQLLRHCKPRCVVVLHDRDIKFLARHLAAQGLKAGFLNPSDCVATMMGLFGFYWESGRGNGYVGEEDWAATSTGVLGTLLGPRLGDCALLGKRPGDQSGSAGERPVTVRLPLSSDPMPLGIVISGNHCTGVRPGSVAEAAGMPLGTVLKVDGQATSRGWDFARAVARARREKQFLELEVLPAKAAAAASAPRRQGGTTPRRTGAELTPRFHSSPPSARAVCGRLPMQVRLSHGLRTAPFGSSQSRGACASSMQTKTPSPASYAPATTRKGGRVGAAAGTKFASDRQQRMTSAETQGPGPGAYKARRGLAAEAAASPRRSAPAFISKSPRMAVTPRANETTTIQTSPPPTRPMDDAWKRDGRPRLPSPEQPTPGPGKYGAAKGIHDAVVTSLHVGAPAIRSGCPRVPQTHPALESGDSSLCQDIQHRATAPPAGCIQGGRWPAVASPERSRTPV
eukprot:TRINITY_DN39311_c0_g1_i1.p1 TRINITY_DN39311_c0_g1~~TRINITY_DN39311_c0_g1_i1.p1  ORF type:complete len:935 (+),score=162.22 TRINITY_DN39311_c0_g1_i1:86-2890(+)